MPERLAEVNGRGQRATVPSPEPHRELASCDLPDARELLIMPRPALPPRLEIEARGPLAGRVAVSVPIGLPPALAERLRSTL